MARTHELTIVQASAATPIGAKAAKFDGSRMDGGERIHASLCQRAI